MRTATTALCTLYIKETCCQDSEHIDNFQDEDYQDIFRETADMVKAFLEAAFPGATIFEPLAAFGGDENSDMAELLSSSGLSIWCPRGPVHLTSIAYGTW